MVKSGRKWDAGAIRRSAYIGKVERMFLGQFEHNLDNKGRLMMPARFRELLETGAYLTQGFDDNLTVLTAASFEAMYRAVNEMSLTDPRTRLLRRLLFSNAVRVEFDKTGRVLIPPFLREAANLRETVMVIGVGDSIEIWSKEAWAAQEAQLQDPDFKTDGFAALNLPVH